MNQAQQRMNHPMKPAWKLWLSLGAALAAFCLLAVAVCEWCISKSAQGRCFDTVASVPSAHAAVVLGTSSKRADGQANRFFGPRMEAAAALFRAGKVKALIVSGDNSTTDYDEPTEMKQALIGLGVPETQIVCDYAGFRTLDSVVRARDVFGQSRVVFVSQRFHNERAIYLARAYEVEAYGLNAKDVPVSASVKTYLREKLACVKAVLDVHVLGTRPKYLGQPVSVP